MANDFFLFKKFTDVASSREIINLLEDNDIECRFHDDTITYTKNINNTFEVGCTLSIKSEDFNKANSVLEKYYLDEIETVDKSYYLFNFSDTELMEIINKPFEWGEFDFHLAKIILKERGTEISEKYIEERKQQRVAALSKIEKVPTYKLIMGYICSLFVPPYAIISGLTILHNGNILPNGKKFYLHSTEDRKHAKIFLTLGIITVVISVLTVIIKANN